MEAATSKWHTRILLNIPFSFQFSFFFLPLSRGLAVGRFRSTGSIYTSGGIRARIHERDKCSYSDSPCNYVRIREVLPTRGRLGNATPDYDINICVLWRCSLYRRCIRCTHTRARTRTYNIDALEMFIYKVYTRIYIHV